MKQGDYTRTGLDPQRDLICASCQYFDEQHASTGYCNHDANRTDFGRAFVTLTGGCQNHSELIAKPGQRAVKPLAGLREGLTVEVARALSDLRYHLGPDGEYTIKKADGGTIDLFEGLMIGGILEKISQWLDPLPEAKE